MKPLEAEKKKKKKKKRTATLRRLQNLLNLRVVTPLDLLLIRKLRLPTGVPVHLEPRRVQRILILLPADVVHGHGPGLRRPLVRFRLADVARRRGASVAGILVVVEVGDHVAGLASFRGRLAHVDFVAVVVVFVVVAVAQKVGCSGRWGGGC